MAVPRFFVERLPESGAIDLPAGEAKHAAAVLRQTAGDVVMLFDGAGGEARATITEISKKRVNLEVCERTDTDRELPYDVTMLVSLPKGDRQRTLIEGVVQLGVTRLVPLTCRRSVAQPTGSALERLKRYVLEASKQCGRNRLLEIAPACKFASLLDVNATTRRIACHPLTGAPHIANLVAGQTASTTQVAIGPEGGFADEEVKQLQTGGWQVASLGPRILRIEMAALMVAANLSR